MIYVDDARMEVTEDDGRLAIREMNHLRRLLRVGVSLPFVSVGVFVIFVVANGGGMKAVTAAEKVVTRVFLGGIGLILGVMPLVFGLRLWMGRKEIVVHASGMIESHFYFGGLRLRSVSVPAVRAEDVGIRSWYEYKTGEHHEVVLFRSDPERMVRLLSLKRKEDAEGWMRRISRWVGEEDAAGGLAVRWDGL